MLALDPENVGILTNAVVARVALGDVAAARPLADRLEAADPNNQVATLVRLGDTLAAGDFAAAQAILDKAGDTLNPLLAGAPRRLDRRRARGLRRRPGHASTP